jgi:hypothetical protein
LKTCCVEYGGFDLEIGSISLDDEFLPDSGFRQLAIIIPGEPRSANKADNIKNRSDMIQRYLQEKLYPSVQSAVKSKTSSAVCPVFFTNAVFMFVNYWPKISSNALKLRSFEDQGTFLRNEKQFKTVSFSHALQLRNVRTADDCGQKVTKVTIYHRNDRELNQESKPVLSNSYLS